METNITKILFGSQSKNSNIEFELIAVVCQKHILNVMSVELGLEQFPIAMRCRGSSNEIEATKYFSVENKVSFLRGTYSCKSITLLYIP